VLLHQKIEVDCGVQQDMILIETEEDMAAIGKERDHSHHVVVEVDGTIKILPMSI
jgi:hypothetical protein